MITKQASITLAVAGAVILIVQFVFPVFGSFATIAGIVLIVFGVKGYIWPWGESQRINRHELFNENSDPFGERDRRQDILTTAATYIKDGKYSEARSILVAIKDDKKAAEWLAKLDDPRYQ
jgi:uncharacterized membrane protein